MKNLLLASTSTLFGEGYLEYLKSPLQTFFSRVSTLTFIPYARPSGISYDAYTQLVSNYFSPMGIAVKGLHTFENPAKAIASSEALFTGGGNTFLLLKTLYDLDLISPLKQACKNGTPYLGTSAGSNIAGISIQTTNDMPIVYPPSFQALGLVPFNINPHYLDPMPQLKHKGETRETRIKEFLTQNTLPVVGLREGSWLQIRNEEIWLKGEFSAPIFEPQKEMYEVNPGTQLRFSIEN